jgi:hypothetical protein
MKIQMMIRLDEVDEVRDVPQEEVASQVDSRVDGIQ